MYQNLWPTLATETETESDAILDVPQALPRFEDVSVTEAESITLTSQKAISLISNDIGS